MMCMCCARVWVQVQNKVSMEGQLQTYRYCDGVWTLMLKDATFKGAEGTLHSPLIKVVACEAKAKPRNRRR